MAEEKKQEKVVLEREYVINLKRKFIDAPQYRRTPKAIRELKRFIARHMKVYDKDLSKILLDRYLNEEMWHRGIRKPTGKIRVKVKKLEDGRVRVELAELPEKLKYKAEREKREKAQMEEKAEGKKEEKKAEGTQTKKEEDKEGEKAEGKEESKNANVEEKKKEEKNEEEKEKIKAVKEADKILAGKEHTEMKHETKISKQPKHQVRKALQK